MVLTAPVVRLGNRLSTAVSPPGAGRDPGVGASLLLGAATGLLWAPCAGPVLGLILTGAALQGANVRTSLLLMAFAAGVVTPWRSPFSLAAGIQHHEANAWRRSEWIRRGLGVAVLAAVAAIALGVDTGFLTRVSLASTSAVEQRLIDWIQPADAMSPPAGTMTGGAGMADAMAGSPAMAGGSAMNAGGAMTGAPAMSDGTALTSGAMMSAKERSHRATRHRTGGCHLCPALLNG